MSHHCATSRSALTSWPTSRDPAFIGPDPRHARKDRMPGAVIEPRIAKRSPTEVLLVFLKLGLTSFGGPVAHHGYFHDEFVVHRRWLEERSYADLVALCQF